MWKWGQISVLDINLLLYSLSPRFISQINVSHIFRIHYDWARIERSRVPQLSGGRVRCGHPPEALLAWRATSQGLAERLKLFPNDSSTFVFLGHLRFVHDSCSSIQLITVNDWNKYTLLYKLSWISGCEYELGHQQLSPHQQLSQMNHFMVYGILSLHQPCLWNQRMEKGRAENNQSLFYLSLCRTCCRVPARF